jgi:broad specificity phosphatase PhoE
MEDAGSSKRITCLETLLETDYGFLEGANGYTYDPYETEMKKNLPLLGSFEERMNYRMVSDMESNQEVFLRIHSLVNDIAQQHFGETVCLLTHNGPLKAMFMHLAAYDFGVDVMYHIFSVGNCAALCLESDGKSIELKRFYNISMRK